jgi:hypothetical protein
MLRTPAAGADVAEVVLGCGEDVAVGVGAEVVGAAPEQAVTSSVSAAHAAYRRVCR